MARQTHDREDLLAEGVNLPERARLRHLPTDREWLIGWRKDGGPAIYDGPDRVFQFNAKNELRRVYLDGEKFAAQDKSLCRMVRPTASQQCQSTDRAQSTERVRMQWQPLSPAGAERIAEEWATTRDSFLSSLESAAAERLARSNGDSSRKDSVYDWQSVGCDSETLLKRTQTWLKSISNNPAIAAQPNA
ncbi:hypothetical protein [Rhodopirellula halodulae]|uniref:hypothetical protein n=1 Tax=Rhodopirellula halodulae TaxID=2894198 RepID=UPI001E4DEE78|nr:hypothetical protein [Rhodopirellula sp. JC737]MCC9656483.1 hypothetical protein [Rhodopirellula sp. JC737]